MNRLRVLEFTPEPAERERDLHKDRRLFHEFWELWSKANDKEDYGSDRRSGLSEIFQAGCAHASYWQRRAEKSERRLKLALGYLTEPQKQQVLSGMGLKLRYAGVLSPAEADLIVGYRALSGRGRRVLRELLKWAQDDNGPSVTDDEAGEAGPDEQAEPKRGA